MKKRFAIYIVLVLSLFLLTACGKTELTGLSIDEAIQPRVLVPGDTLLVEPIYTFSKEEPSAEQQAEALDAAALVWVSSDEAVATVEDGTVTAVAPGVADISVQAGELSASVQITVVVPVESITVPEEIEIALNEDAQAQLDVQLVPEDSSSVELDFSSSDEDVVTVSATGQLDAVSVGEAVITTTATGVDANGEEKTVTAETKVTVYVAAEDINLTSTDGILYVGQTYTLEPSPVPEDAEDSYTFASDDEAVATVNGDGEITAVAPGTATITITGKASHTAEYTVIVRANSTGGGGNTSGDGSGTGTTGGSAGGGSTNGGTGGSTGGGGGNTGGGITGGGGGSNDGGTGGDSGGSTGGGSDDQTAGSPGHGAMEEIDGPGDDTHGGDVGGV